MKCAPPLNVELGTIFEISIRFKSVHTLRLVQALRLVPVSRMVPGLNSVNILLSVLASKLEHMLWLEQAVRNLKLALVASNLYQS